MKISTIADLPPQLVLEWMRRLRDGKLVEAHWVLFRAVVVSPGTSPEQVDLLRAPLFADTHTMRADVIALRSPAHHRTLFSQRPSARLGPQGPPQCLLFIRREERPNIPSIHKKRKLL